MFDEVDDEFYVFKIPCLKNILMLVPKSYAGIVDCREPWIQLEIDGCGAGCHPVTALSVIFDNTMGYFLFMHDKIAFIV